MTGSERISDFRIRKAKHHSGNQNIESCRAMAVLEKGKTAWMQCVGCVPGLQILIIILTAARTGICREGFSRSGWMSLKTLSSSASETNLNHLEEETPHNARVLIQRRSRLWGGIKVWAWCSIDFTIASLGFRVWSIGLEDLFPTAKLPTLCLTTWSTTERGMAIRGFWIAGWIIPHAGLRV